jgi:hypothetical protein
MCERSVRDSSAFSGEIVATSFREKRKINKQPAEEDGKLVSQDRAIDQEVSRRVPTAAARVLAQFRSCGIFGRQCGTAAGFLQVLPFPLPFLIPPTAPH